MALAIQIIMACSLSMQDAAPVETPAAATGTCSGTYARTETGEQMGSWALKVKLSKGPDGKMVASKIGGFLIVPEYQTDKAGMAELEENTLHFIAKEIESKGSVAKPSEESPIAY